MPEPISPSDKHWHTCKTCEHFAGMDPDERIGWVYGTCSWPLNNLCEALFDSVQAAYDGEVSTKSNQGHYCNFWKLNVLNYREVQP